MERADTDSRTTAYQPGPSTPAERIKPVTRSRKITAVTATDQFPAPRLPKITAVTATDQSPAPRLPKRRPGRPLGSKTKSQKIGFSRRKGVKRTLNPSVGFDKPGTARTAKLGERLTGCDIS